MTRLEAFRQTALLWAWAYRNIRLLWYVQPRVVEAGADRCVLRVPLSRRTRNHVGSMYFGALCTGADAVVALLVMTALRANGGKFSILFKDVRAEFVKRAERDVYFACDQGREVREILEAASKSGERVSRTLRVVATVPAISPLEPVAQFEMTLSVKKRED